MSEQQQSTTESATIADANVFATGGTANLPMVIETKGDDELINRDEMSPSDLAEVEKIVAGHDIMNTAANLYYGAAPQNAFNSILDQLLAGIKAKDAGLAGQLAIELNDGIDLLKLDQTKDQIVNGQGLFSKIFSGIIEALGGIANYVNYLMQSQDTIIKKFDELVEKYNNRIQTLTNESDKLDKLRNATIEQINGIRIYIAAGEDILKKAKAEYDELAKAALQSNDTLKLQDVRDRYQQIASFDTRFIQLKLAYVEASSVTIPRVRRTQDAIKIEIEGIVRGILFVIPKLKASIVELIALYETKEAQKDRQALDEVESRLNKHTTEIVDEVVNVAKQSQGLALKRAQEIEALVESTITAIETDRENEKQSAENRRAAEDLLVKLKNQVDASIKKANMDAAAEKI